MSLVFCCVYYFIFCIFKQKPAYEMRISDWSSDVCSSDLFMPPLQQAEDYLDLVTAIEDTAAMLGRKVVIEGYLPPRDPRLLNFSVTPDPGVIEEIGRASGRERVCQYV